MTEMLCIAGTALGLALPAPASTMHRPSAKMARKDDSMFGVPLLKIKVTKNPRAWSVTITLGLI
ncbi:hypothetical protein [Methylobacterium oryzihabitans]|uniref:Uncharacterized protein n=1 Tax=Methylobacterium oryzihabitans TaxID=2499852 RepID=A0A437NR30_9HYPH|nr:hypothetical protein [Methylobacterium oryzihabitans]RVU12506.1 hypothetical protein EOE48_27870 [Methylobacterium oryzihabitans]